MVYHIYYLFFFSYYFYIFLEVLQCRRIEKFTFSMDQMERMQIDQLDAECFMVNLCFSATLATLQHSGYFDVDIITFSRMATFFAVFFSLFLKSIAKGISDRGCVSFHNFIFYNECNYEPPRDRRIRH
jgi:hypothetical protein